MKAPLTLLMFLTFGMVITSCEDKTEKEENLETEEMTVNLINDEFPEAKKEIRMTMDSIVQSVKDGDLDRLISFHAYGPKFSEFKNGEMRNDDEENEKFERGVFGSVTNISKFDMNDMKIAVFGDVANVTTHTDFHMEFGEDAMVVNEQMSLLFVNTNEGWRIVHEHHSPLNTETE